MARRKERVSLYDEVTSTIIAELEEGPAPWVRPWGRSPESPAAGLPRNAATHRSYSGINILLLWGAVIEKAYPSQDWLTFRQAHSLGGTVRKGERGTTVVYANRFTPKDDTGETGVEGGTGSETSESGAETPRAVPFLKRYTVFNVAQCDGLPDRVTAGEAPRPVCETIPEAEALIAATGADIRIGGDRAFYAPATDHIQLPPQPAFFAQIDYYRTAFHELGHWTGHPTRLARDLSHRFGSKPYAREELVAELAAAFTCAALAIAPTVRHADYIGSWLEVLREDNRAIFRAASAASRAGRRTCRRSPATTGSSIPGPAPRPISSTSSTTANPTQRRPDTWNWPISPSTT